MAICFGIQFLDAIRRHLIPSQFIWLCLFPLSLLGNNLFCLGNVLTKSKKVFIVDIMIILGKFNVSLT